MPEIKQYKFPHEQLCWKSVLRWSALPAIALLVVLLFLPSFTRSANGFPVEDSLPVDGSLPADGSFPADGSLTADGSLPADGSFPVDDSFNVNAAFEKARKEYPQIAIAKVAPAADTQVERNLVYRQLGERALHLDLFRPRAPSEQQGRPAVLLVHGGGWRSGNRTLQEPMATYLANRGFVAATVEYRLSLEARYPAGVRDLKSAVGWLRLHADEYGIDPQRIAILGASAGAQLATLVGVTPGAEAFATPQSHGRDTLQAIVNLDGVVSFTTPMALRHENDPRKKPSAAGAWFGGRFEEVPELWREASPLEYAGAGSPPTLFINSSRPRFHAGRDEYIARLADASIPTAMMSHDDSPHPFWLFQPWFEPTAERVADFLLLTLK